MDARQIVPNPKATLHSWQAAQNSSRGCVLAGVEKQVPHCLDLYVIRFSAQGDCFAYHLCLHLKLSGPCLSFEILASTSVILAALSKSYSSPLSPGHSHDISLPVLRFGKDLIIASHA